MHQSISTTEEGERSQPRPVLYTVKEVADMMHCSTRTVYRLIKAGEIPSTDSALGKKRIPAVPFHAKFDR